MKNEKLPTQIEVIESTRKQYAPVEKRFRNKKREAKSDKVGRKAKYK